MDRLKHQYKKDDHKAAALPLTMTPYFKSRCIICPKSCIQYAKR